MEVPTVVDHEAGFAETMDVVDAFTGADEDNRHHDEDDDGDQAEADAPALGLTRTATVPTHSG